MIRNYRFTKGDQFANPCTKFLWDTHKLQMNIRFWRDCYYDELPEGMEGDWNKTGYFSMLWPWWDGITFGWKWVNEGGERVFKIGWYFHDNSPQHNAGELLTIKPSVDLPANWEYIDIYCYIDKTKGVEFMAGFKKRFNSIYFNKELRGRWIQAPQFGGQSKAPKTMSIDIEYINI